MNMNLVVCLRQTRSSQSPIAARKFRAASSSKSGLSALKRNSLHGTQNPPSHQVGSSNLNLCTGSKPLASETKQCLEVSCFSLAGNSVYKTLKESKVQMHRSRQHCPLFEDREKLRVRATDHMPQQIQSVQNLNWGELRLQGASRPSKRLCKTVQQPLAFSNSLKSNFYHDLVWAISGVTGFNVTQTLCNIMKNLGK